MVVTSLLLLLHTTACLLLTQIPRLRRSSVLRTDSQLILREFDFFGRGERREDVAVNVSRYDHEAVNLISKLSKQLEDQEQLIQAIADSTLNKKPEDNINMTNITKKMPEKNNYVNMPKNMQS